MCQFSELLSWRHFINSVKLCLWLILHYLDLLVNSANLSTWTSFCLWVETCLNSLFVSVMVVYIMWSLRTDVITGSEQNQTLFHGFLHSCLKVKYSVRCRHSWLPLRRKRVLGWLIFRAHRYRTHCRHTDGEESIRNTSSDHWEFIIELTNQYCRWCETWYDLFILITELDSPSLHTRLTTVMMQVCSERALFGWYYQHVAVAQR